MVYTYFVTSSSIAWSKGMVSLSPNSPDQSTLYIIDDNPGGNTELGSFTAGVTTLEKLRGIPD